MSGERTLNYSIHCAFKHITGVTKGLKEFLSKVGRVYTDLLTKNNLTEEDRKFILYITNEVRNMLKEMTDLSYLLFKYEINLEEYTNEEILVIMSKLTTTRVKLEELLGKWMQFLASKGYKEEDISAHYAELLEVLSDLYKIEQDHMPEIFREIRFEIKTEQKEKQQ